MFVPPHWQKVLIPIRPLPANCCLMEGMQFSDTHTVSRKDFEEFGRRIGLSPRLVKRELDIFATEHPLAHELINRSFLSEKLKRYYWQSYNYRRTTLTPYHGE